MVKHLSQQPSAQQARLPIRILQLTDSHLLADKTRSFIGINPYLSLQQIIVDAQRYAPYDCIISTGDLAQEPSQAAYQDYLDAVQCLNSEHLYIRGNHDVGAHFPPNHDTGHPDVQLLRIENWCLIALNSQTDDGSYGVLSQATLDELNQQLARHPEQHILLAIHHHSLAVGCAWLDQQNLINSAEFIACIQQYPQVKAVINGHVHQATQQSQHNICFMSCPSTCVQFTPNSDQFSLNPHPPGYRILELYEDGSIASTIQYIEEFLGKLDPELTHY